MPIRTLLIEDEQPARELVKHFLAGSADIEIIGECADGFAGLKAIQDLKPDLVFLDIQLPKLTGLELLELLENPPVIIFTTAYDQYAIKAFEMNALDYLLKPFSLDRFNAALEKARLRISSGKSDKPNVDKLLQHQSEQQGFLDRVAIKSGSRIHVVPTGSIRYIEAQDDYVMIYCAEGKFLKEKTMKYFEAHLEPDMFVRIHRSYIINVQEIKQIEPLEKDSYVVILKDGAKLRASATGYKTLRERLGY
jgi:two-component system, LytTR family, response regulator